MQYNPSSSCARAPLPTCSAVACRPSGFQFLTATVAYGGEAVKGACLREALPGGSRKATVHEPDCQTVTQTMASCDNDAPSIHAGYEPQHPHL
jgi:hypothetical protein